VYTPSQTERETAAAEHPSNKQNNAMRVQSIGLPRVATNIVCDGARAG